jgi:hypothetical protein
VSINNPSGPSLHCWDKASLWHTGLLLELLAGVQQQQLLHHKHHQHDQQQQQCMTTVSPMPYRGGYKVVGQNGGVKWPNGRHGLCGDQAGGAQPFMKPGPVRGESAQHSSCIDALAMGHCLDASPLLQLGLGLSQRSG